MPGSNEVDPVANAPSRGPIKLKRIQRHKSSLLDLMQILEHLTEKQAGGYAHKQKEPRMIENEAASIVRSYCDAWLGGDTIKILSLYHDDLTLYWSGRHHLAGTHIGQGESINALLALQALTNRKPLRVVDIFTGTDSVIALVVEQWSRDTETIELTRALDFTVANGKLRTCRIYESNQPAIDDWLSRDRSTSGAT